MLVSVLIAVLTLLDNEIGNDENHGVAGEDVVATELLLVTQRYSSISSYPCQLGPNLWTVMIVKFSMKY